MHLAWIGRLSGRGWGEVARSIKLKVFAGLLLRAMARERAEKGTERVSPRDPGVASRLGVEPDSPALMAAVRYLVSEGYIAPISHAKDDSFTITVLGWEDLGFDLTAEGWHRRSWWRRLLGV